MSTQMGEKVAAKINNNVKMEFKSISRLNSVVFESITTIEVKNTIMTLKNIESLGCDKLQNI